MEQTDYPQPVPEDDPWQGLGSSPPANPGPPSYSSLPPSPAGAVPGRPLSPPGQPPQYPPPGQWPPPGYPSAGPPAPGATAGAGQPARKQRNGPIGAIFAAAVAVAKFGAIFLKLGGTLLSLAISVVAMSLLFGWSFGLGVIVLIAIHESGHILFARKLGFPVSWPIFLGPFGALVTMKRRPTTRGEEAFLAIGGPILGLLAAGGALLIGFLTSDQTGYWTALAYFGCFLTVFNLIPISPLDGGRVAKAVSIWTNVAGLVILAAFIAAEFLLTGVISPVALIVALFGAIGVVSRFRHPDGLKELSVWGRVGVAAAYMTILLIALGGTAYTSMLLASSGVSVGF